MFSPVSKDKDGTFRSGAENYMRSPTGACVYVYAH